MKKYLIGAVAAAAMLTPAVAAADTNAVIGLDFGNTDFDGGDFDRLGFNAAFSHDFNNGWFLQFDGEHNRLDVGGSGDLAAGYGAVHAGMRHEGHAVAGFLSFEDFFALSGTGVGLEGQMYLQNFVVGGSLGYLDFSDVDLSVTSVQLDGAYFITPNFAVNALVAQSEADFGGGGDDEWTSLGLGGEYRFGGPISISANWRSDEFDSYDADTWTIGFTFDLGTGSLHERQTSGPSMQGAGNLSHSINGLLP